RPRPHFNDRIPLRRTPRIRHEPQQILIDHKVLPKPMPRRHPGLGKKSLNLLLGLHCCFSPALPDLLITRRCYTILAMKSYDVIRAAVEEPGVKAVAAALRVSPALVYKWCEPPADSEDPEQSGAKNPLDRVAEMYQLTKDIRLIRHLCNQAGGFFVANPQLDARKPLEENI